MNLLSNRSVFGHKVVTKTAQIALLTLSVSLAGFSFAEPSKQEIYATASAGNLPKAEAMIREVLTAHPNSAQAHFIAAEILAKENRIGDARNEFAQAEKIQPNLSFAKPEAVESLRHQVFGNTHHASSSSTSPLLMWGGIALLVIVGILFFRALFRRPQFQPVYGNGSQPMQAGYGPAGYPQGGGYGPQGYGPQGGGLGSGIMGGLATGAAVGAGIVAGEVLMHNILDDHPNRSSNDPYIPPAQDNNYDMGGNNFGVNDNGSWDNDSSFTDNSSSGDFGGSDSDWS